jgi:hypothetical protein
MIDLKALKKIFKDSPNKSKFTFKGKCSGCGCTLTIDIISETEGFGLQGGVLYKFEKDWYFAKCSDCYKVNPKIVDHSMPRDKCTIVKNNPNTSVLS